MKPKWEIIVLFYSNLAPPPQPLWNATWIDKLKRDLLLNYDKFARPSEHYNTTKVALSLTVKHLDLEESKGVLTIYGWLSMVIVVLLVNNINYNSQDEYRNLKAKKRQFLNNLRSNGRSD